MPHYEPVIRPGIGPELMLRLAWPSSLPVGDYRDVEIDHWVVDRRRRLTLTADATDNLYVVCSGVLFEVARTPSDNPAVVRTWRRGEMFLASELIGTLRSCGSAVEVVRIRNWESFIALRQAVTAHRMNELLQMKRKLAECKGDTIRARIRRYSSAQTYDLDLTFTDAAQEVGCSRESFSREFNRLSEIYQRSKAPDVLCKSAQGETK